MDKRPEDTFDLHDNVTRNQRCKTPEELMAEMRAYLACGHRAGHQTQAREVRIVVSSLIGRVGTISREGLSGCELSCSE